MQPGRKPEKTATAPDPATPLAAFVALEAKMRAAEDTTSLSFVLCNETRSVLHYRQAFLLEIRNGRWRVACVSSLPSFDADAPVVRFVERVAAKCLQHAACETFDLNEVAAELGPDKPTYPFAKALLVPLARGGTPFAAVLFARERPWLDDEMPMVDGFADAAAHAWQARCKPKTRLANARSRIARWSAVLAIVVFAGVLVPVPLTALAPAEIIARDPSVVSAPLDGVIAKLPVAPNMPVAKGDIILAFENTKLANDARIARQARVVAQAKLMRTIQSTFSAPQDARDIAIARAELALAEAEEKRAAELLRRSVVRAPRDGLLVYSSREDWIGKPVSTGERIMDIVDPARTELRIDLALADAIALKKGARITFFPDGDPLQKYRGVLERPGFHAMKTVAGTLAYRSFATLQPHVGDAGGGKLLRIGARGTAKIYGESVSLGFYLFRRPLATVRQQVGL